MQTEGREGSEGRDNSVCGTISGSTCRTLRAIAPTHKSVLIRVNGIGAPYPVPLTAAL